MQFEKAILPIDRHVPDILNAIQNHSTVLVKASPGSGKTTRLPWAITTQLNKKVVVLEPRRLAAKLAAQRIAEEQNLTLGKEVGFHFRFERLMNDETSLVFYTEGTFLKRFINDSTLSGVDVVILDEFHERHLETDLALALLKEVQKKRAIKIILMSATLDMKLLEHFPEAAHVEIEAPHFPVELHYLPNQPSILNQTLEQKVKKAVDENPAGDMLVFLPGMREMLKVKDALHSHHVLLLHADLTKEEQAEALHPSKFRKIILATNIAESSVTIPGITIVIDSGIQREAHYSPWNGLKFIQDTPITKSSAVQRAGRAGRTGPGKCIRLYSQQDFNERPDFTIPEIERADLTDICLLVTGAGLKPDWFHPPPPEKWQKAFELLMRLGAIRENKLTDIGKKMLDFPLDARLARILTGASSIETKAKEALLRYICDEIEEDRSGTLKRRLQFFTKTPGTDKTPWEKFILSGFVDQVAKYRTKHRDFIHYSGKTIKAHSSLSDLHDDFYIILDITQRQEAIKIFPVDESWLWELDPFPFTEEDTIEMGDKIKIIRKTKFGSIVIEEEVIRTDWNALPQESRQKMIMLAESPVKNRIKDFLEQPRFQKMIYWAGLQKKSFESALEELTVEDYFNQYPELDFSQFENFIFDSLKEKMAMPDLERELPSKINLGGRRELQVHYPNGMDPYLEAPIQDFYGLMETPTIMGGKVPLLLKLLGPHKRPIQVTRDLKNFWNKTYQEMKKEYQRDYPRHYWPDKPWEAKPFLLKSHLPKA